MTKIILSKYCKYFFLSLHNFSFPANTSYVFLVLETFLGCKWNSLFWKEKGKGVLYIVSKSQNSAW